MGGGGKVGGKTYGFQGERRGYQSSRIKEKKRGEGGNYSKLIAN